MTDQGTDQAGPPRQFALTVPGWWPRIEPVSEAADRVPVELSPEQSQALREMSAQVTIPDGTRCVSIMTTAEDQPRPFGVMYLNHSETAAAVMSGMLGVELTPAELPDLRSVGRLDDVELSLVHFDTVGAVSCVTARRAPAPADPERPATLVRAYLIPEPQTSKAVLILYIASYQEHAVGPFAEMCDQITSTFSWRW